MTVWAVLGVSALLGAPILQEDRPLDWLRQHAAPIESPTELGQAAKRALRQAIGTRRLVMLGELTHGDGTSFHLKAAIVRFLHQEMGFDVLILGVGVVRLQRHERQAGLSR